MLNPVNDNATVTYGVKELLEQIKLAQAEGFAQVTAALVTKADKADVARMESRLDQHGKQLADHALRLTKVESVQHDQELVSGVHEDHDERHWSWRKRFWAVLGSLGLMTATIFGPYLGTHLHF